MRAVYKRPGENPIILDIQNDLETLQRMVGGYIEHVRLTDKVGIVINEEGKLHNMEPNFFLRNDMIVGPALFVGEAIEDFTDVPEDLAELIAMQYAEV